MCFSAPASFIAGASLTTIGVVTTKNARTKKEWPLALVPILFGIQQSIEGVIWLVLGRDMNALLMGAAYSYLVFAYVIWPIWIPIAIIMIEPDRHRRHWLIVISLIGVATGSYLLYLISATPINVAIVNQSMSYGLVYPYQNLLILGYFLATCASGLFSSHRLINIFGLMVALTGIAAYNFYLTSFISVWCFFATIVSVLIYVYLNSNRK